MTDQELIERLRNLATNMFQSGNWGKDLDTTKAAADRIEQLKQRLFQCATDLQIYMDAYSEERAKLKKAMRIIEAIVEDEGYIPKRVESDYLDLYKTLDESL